MKTKNEIAVKITAKNRKKLANILEMFGEDVFNNELIEGTYCSLCRAPFTENVKVWNCYSDIFLNKTLVKPKELKQILAREKLRMWDYVVVEDCFGDKYTIKISEITNDSICAQNMTISFSFSQFKRYATKEEIELLEGKPKELEAWKWYKSLTCPEFLGIHLKENRYGFDSSGVWFDNYNDTCLDNKLFINNLVEATTQEIEDALIKEAKRRGFVKGCSHTITNGSIEINNKTNEIYGFYNPENKLLFNNWSIFENGKWAELIEEEKPKVGDVCKFWDNNSDEYIIDEIVFMDNEFYNSKNFSVHWNNAKKLTKEEVLTLLGL